MSSPAAAGWSAAVGGSATVGLSAAVALSAAAGLSGPAGRLRTDSRVTASMNATPSAARPASCASMTGVPIGIASEFATRRATSLLPWPGFGAGLGTADGFTVGNRPDALPPGLRLVDPAPAIVGRLPTGSGDVTLPVPPAPVPPGPPVPPVPVLAEVEAEALGVLDAGGLVTPPVS